MSHRILRINQLIRQEISDLLQSQVKDPRLGTFVAITEVSTSQDLKYAKVFVSFIGTREEKQKTLEVLAAASGFFRRKLTKNLKLRRVPELSFHWDDSIERGDHLMRLIDRISSKEL